MLARPRRLEAAVIGPSRGQSRAGPPAALDPVAVAELFALLSETLDWGRTPAVSAVFRGLLAHQGGVDGAAVSWAIGWLRDVEGAGKGQGSDFLDEVIAERVAADPDFAAKVAAALRRRAAGRARPSGGSGR